MNNIEVKYNPYELKFTTPFNTSKSKISNRKGFIISIKSSSGKIGVGDVCPLSEFGSETYKEAENQIANLKIDLKVDSNNLNNSLKNILYKYNSYPAFKHGLEQAIINLICIENNISIAQLLNLKLRKVINVNAVIGFLSPEEATFLAANLVKAGFKTLKVKTGRNNFDEDFNTVRSIRNAVGDEIKIRIDSNGKWSAEQADDCLNKLSDFSIEYAEQPVRTIENFITLRKKSSFPLAADESIRDFETAEKFITHKLVDFVILKPMILGGLISTLEIIELADKNNIIPVITSSFESTVGRANAVIAASVCKSEIAHGLAVSKYLENDFTKEKYPIVKGKIKVF